MPVTITRQDKLFVLCAIALIVFSDGSGPLATVTFSALTAACLLSALINRKPGDRISIRDVVPMVLALSGLCIALSGVDVIL